jgi:hypothetical protein
MRPGPWLCAALLNCARRAAVFGDKDPRELLGEVRGHGRNVNAPGREMRISGVSDCWRGVAAPLPWRDSISAPCVTDIVPTRLGHLDP